MRVNVVNGFSEHPEGGNPAGVVYLNEELCLKEQNRHQDCDGEKPEHLTDEQMQQAAARLHFSETAFITRLNDRSFAIRYFTPAAEVPLCGHATIASFSYLYQKGVIGDGVYELVTTEAQLAVDMEKMYSKDEILLMYLNTINYGDGCYGIEAAAQNYFQV